MKKCTMLIGTIVCVVYLCLLAMFIHRGLQACPNSAIYVYCPSK
jgi:hypothetical protein